MHLCYATNKELLLFIAEEEEEEEKPKKKSSKKRSKKDDDDDDDFDGAAEVDGNSCMDLFLPISNLHSL